MARCIIVLAQPNAPPKSQFTSLQSQLFKFFSGLSQAELLRDQVLYTCLIKLTSRPHLSNRLKRPFSQFWPKFSNLAANFVHEFSAKFRNLTTPNFLSLAHAAIATDGHEDCPEKMRRAPRRRALPGAAHRVPPSPGCWLLAAASNNKACRARRVIFSAEFSAQFFRDSLLRGGARCKAL